MSDLLETFNLRCPRCRQTDELRIDISALADVTADGSEVTGDHEWSDEAYCECRPCGYRATVADFTVKKTKRRKP